MNGKFSYIPVSNAQRSKMAQSKIERTGYSDALENWRSQVRSGKTSADIIATGAELYNAAVNSGDAKQAMNILYDYTQAVRSGAQATQAARILKTLTPSGKLYMLQKEVNNLNDKQSGKASKKSSERENVSALDNVPVEIWMQRVGENLADYLSSRAQVSQQSAKTISQTILSDLRRFANDTAPKAAKSKNTRTELDRIVDLFQNKEAYNEAWQAAKDTLSDEFRNDPDALSAFDAWLDSSLSYVDRLTNEIAKQNPRSKKLAEDGKISIDEGLAEAYLRATTEEERAIAYDKMVQNIADQIPPDFVDKWNALALYLDACNPRTHIRNTGGNIFFQPVRITKDRIAAVIEAGVNARGGNIERTKSFIANPSLYKVAWKDWVNVKDSLTGSKYNDLSSEINDRRRIFKKGAPTKPLNF